jgi:hypothetical protein
MRTTTIPAIAAALLALASCTPTATTVEGRPVEAAGSPASRLHLDVLAGTRPTSPPPHDLDVARQVVTVEAAPPPPPAARVPSATGQLLQAPAPPPNGPDRTDAVGDDSHIRGRGWPSDGPAAAAVVELERRFAAEGLAVLDADVRPIDGLEVTRDAGTGVALEIVVVHTSGHSHPHQSAYLATLADYDGGWQLLELEARP